MSNPELDPNIKIEIRDNDAKSFIYNVNTGSIIESAENIETIVSLDTQTYQAIKVGQSTCEQEIQNGNLSISGNLGLLRELGKAFRAQH